MDGCVSQVQLQSDWQTETILVRLQSLEVGAVLHRVLHLSEGPKGPNESLTKTQRRPNEGPTKA